MTMPRRVRLSAFLHLAVLATLTACGDGPVQSESVRTILLSPDTAYAPLGSSVQLHASARSAADRILSGRSFTWTSSDTSVATVSASGLVTAKGYGDASISAMADGVTGRSVVRVTGSPGVRVVSGAGVADSATATLTAPLVVEVRDSRGLPIPGVTVEFLSTGDQISNQGYTYTVRHLHLSRIGGTAGEEAVTETTDTRGRAAVRVRFGQRAAAAGVILNVPTLEYADTARYTIQPGNAARIVAAPRDTALYAGRSYVLRADVLDRYGNVRTDPATYQVIAGPITVNASTRTVSGTSIGRGAVVVQVHGMADTSHVSVVPQGVLAATRSVHHTGQAAEVVMFNLDGSAQRRLATTSLAGWFIDMAPRWNPAGTRVVYHDGGYDKRLFTVDTLGSVQRLVTTSYPVQSETWAQYSRDGAWIYYSGRPDHQNNGLWRVRADGSSPEMIGPAIGWYDVDSNPSPSPDGKRLVYVTNRTFSIVMRILDIETGAVTPLEIPGATPVWSPQGDRIAYEADGHLRVMKADGTEQREISQPNRRYSYGIDWSPDAEWIVARSSSGGVIDLIHVESGLTLPLPFTAAFAQPAWRPRQ